MNDQAYGLWPLVAMNSIIFIFFAFSFTKPKTKRDWRSLGVFSAFVVAMFTEMYGFPLTIYFLSGWLSEKFPNVDFLTHDNGHLLHTLFGLDGNPHFDPLHIASNLLIIAGFLTLAASWNLLHAAQQKGEMATKGIYSSIRHPQYVAFVVIMFGFLIQWPTLPTLVLFPVMTYIYIRLARAEERSALDQYGQAYLDYMQMTPAFFPNNFLRRVKGNHHE